MLPAGQMKDIVTTALGMFMFGDVLLEVKNLIGVLVGLAGGMLYAWIQYRGSMQPRAYKPLASSAGSLGRSGQLARPISAAKHSPA